MATERDLKDIIALLTESYIIISDLTRDLDSNITSEFRVLDFDLDIDYERPRSDNSRDNDSVYSHLLNY